jgi:hypothetical protein
MAFKKGDKKPPNSGKTKGTLNKVTASLINYIDDNKIYSLVKQLKFFMAVLLAVASLTQ